MPTKNIPSYNENDSQIGISDEQASFWWSTLNENLLKKFVSKYKHKKWLREVYGSLPVNVKNDFKKWLITKDAKHGIKISNNSEHRGGKLKGKFHKDGGIRGVIMETGKPIEVENEELITTRGVSQSEDIVTCHGKPEAIVSDLNQKYGGDKISDKKGNCKIKKYIMKKGGKIITMDDGFRFKVVSFDYAKKNWDKEQIYKIFEEEGTESLVDDGRRLTRSGVYAIEIGREKKFNDLKMKTGSKIKSHIDNRKIERMIIRENELKRADNGMKVEDNDEQAAIELQQANEYILITEPEAYAIMQFVDNIELHEYEKAVPRFISKGNEICIYKYDQYLVDFLNKWGIHHVIYEHRDELMVYLKSLLPERIKNRIQ